MKTTSYILAIILIFGSSVYVNGQSEGESKYFSDQSACIENIIKQDDELGTTRNHDCEKISLSQTIANYTNALEALDYSTCPEDFVSSFHKHIEAWKLLPAITDNYSSLRGEMHDLFDTIYLSKDSTEFKALVQEVWDTWYEVEKNMK